MLIYINNTFYSMYFEDKEIIKISYIEKNPIFILQIMFLYCTSKRDIKLIFQYLITMVLYAINISGRTIKHDPLCFISKLNFKLLIVNQNSLLCHFIKDDTDFINMSTLT